MQFSLSNKRRVQVIRVGRRQTPVLVIDTFLHNPELLVEAACRIPFGLPRTPYPGVIADFPNGYLQTLAQGMASLVEQVYWLDPKSARITDRFFGLATHPPQSLEPAARFPHIDEGDPHLLAFLHYLCGAEQGGTGFYRHRETGWELLIADQELQMIEMVKKDHGQSPLPARYPDAQHPLYEQIGFVEASFNRLLVYPANLLHGMSIGPGTSFCSDPRSGRLTVNTFVHFAPSALCHLCSFAPKKGK